MTRAEDAYVEHSPRSVPRWRSSHGWCPGSCCTRRLIGRSLRWRAAIARRKCNAALEITGIMPRKLQQGLDIVYLNLLFSTIKSITHGGPARQDEDPRAMQLNTYVCIARSTQNCFTRTWIC